MIVRRVASVMIAAVVAATGQVRSAEMHRFVPQAFYNTYSAAHPPALRIRPGDRVFFAPGENHWHGAAPTRLMTHVAMQQADDDGSVVTWGEHVSDDEYADAPPIEDGGR